MVAAWLLLLTVCLALSLPHQVTSNLYLFPAKNEELRDAHMRHKDYMDRLNTFDDAEDEDSYDKLHLFPGSKLCMNPFDDDDDDQEKSVGQIERFCRQYCDGGARLQKNGSSTASTKTSNPTTTATTTNTAESIRLVFEDDHSNTLNMTGVMQHYKSVVATFVSHLNEHTDHIEKFKKTQRQKIDDAELGLINDNEEADESYMNFQLNLKLSPHEISMLQRLTSATTDTEMSARILDATDILKAMMASIQLPQKRTNDINNNEDVMSIFSSISRNQNSFSFTNFVTEQNQHFLHYAMAAFFVALGMAVMPLLVRSRQFSWRKVVWFVLLLAFVISVMNNHSYLTQKKEIYKRQKLKEEVPDECRQGVDEDTQNNAKRSSSSLWRDVYASIRYNLGYTATSRRCIEYHEALYLTSTHNNWLETIVYTCTETVRPLTLAFGDSINQFYSAITKDLSFWQYIPLLIFVTIMTLIVVVFGGSLLLLVLFGYEFNFLFSLISLRKSKPSAPSPKRSALSPSGERKLQQIEESNEKHKQAMLQMVHDLKKENRILNIKTAVANKQASLALTAKHHHHNEQQKSGVQVIKSLGNIPMPTMMNSVESSCTSIKPNLIYNKAERVYTLDTFESSQINLDSSQYDVGGPDYCSGSSNNSNNSNNSHNTAERDSQEEETEDEEDLNESLAKNFELYKEKNEKRDKFFDEKISELKDENDKLKAIFNEIDSQVFLDNKELATKNRRMLTTSPQLISKLVSIGLSKSIKSSSSSPSSSSSSSKKQSKNNIGIHNQREEDTEDTDTDTNSVLAISATSKREGTNDGDDRRRRDTGGNDADDDDEEEDIYVVLDEH